MSHCCAWCNKTTIGVKSSKEWAPGVRLHTDVCWDRYAATQTPYVFEHPNRPHLPGDGLQVAKLELHLDE